MKGFYYSLIGLLIMLALPAHAQKAAKLPKFNKAKEKNTFLKKQWFLGFKAGVNLSGAESIKSYAAISPINYELSTAEKTYSNYKHPGTQATLEATFYFSGLSVSVQPTYRHNRFVYFNHYVWADVGNPVNRLELNYRQEQNIDYFDIPVLVKYEKTFNRISPYIQGGVYYAFLIDASKAVTVSGIDYASGSTNEFKNETIMVGAGDLFAKRHWGLLGGVGMYYNQGNIRFSLDIVFRHSLSNIASVQNRFGSDRLSGVGDTMDDMLLNSISITAGCLFPLRFLSKNFSSTTSSF